MSMSNSYETKEFTLNQSLETNLDIYVHMYVSLAK